MHHLESAEDCPGNKMSHAGVFSSRRGSNTGSGGMSGPTVVCNVTLSEEQHQSSVSLHHPPATGSSPPGPHHPPNSLSLHTQSLQSTGAQVKKKSGFQITSVLPAQVSASTNNSIADDTESYDDMDESHTEDLSSSDILDVSVSRATDTGIPERSSSEETLNSLHGGETPGVGSPNEPVKPQSLSHGYMVNGTVHHHTRHAQEHNKDQGMQPVSSAQTTQGRPLGSASVANSASATSPAIQSGSVIQGRSERASSIQAAGVDVSAAGLVTTTVTLASVSTAVGSATTMLGGGVVVAAASSGNMPGVGSGTQPVTCTTQIPASTASRFRVVKLDSSSEPFRKGRWMCTEFYEKEAPPPLSTDSVVHHRTVESFIQSESETTSGSSSCSTMSGGADPGTQPIQQTFVQTGPHIGLSQATPQQLHSLSQDPGVHSVSLASVSPNNPQVVPGTVGIEGQPPTSRIQHVLYTIDSQTRQVQNAGFSANQQQTSVPVSQGMQQLEYNQISQSIQAPGVIHQIPAVQAGMAPRVASNAALPVGPSPVAVPQALSPRPQGSVPQMVVAQGSTINQAAQHSPQIAPEQQAAGGHSPHVTTLPTAKPAPTISPTSLQSNLQSGLPQTLQHGGPVPGHTSVLGLGLNHPGVQSPQLSLGRGPYGGMVTLTASKLEDAGRLLFQHQSLLSLPRLAAGGMSGLIGQAGTEVAAALGSVGDTSASATAAGSDEDSFSGAGVVAIDNKIEQAMDLVKSHLMFAVREEVEVLKEQIKDLIERNLQLEQENILLKNLSSPEQLAQFHAQVQSASPTLGTQSSTTGAAPTSQIPGPQGPPV